MWAGGKNRMLKKYEPHLPDTFNKYIEPFFGGGAMFLWARKANPKAEFVINDSNKSIISIYREIRENVEPFKACLNSLEEQYLPLDKPARKEWFYELRNEHAYDHSKWSRTEEAAALYFLMKTAFNGIWQINKNTNGRFGTPFGLGNQTTKVYDRDVVDWWNKALQRTVILCEDFEPVVKAHAHIGSFVFMDPPYRGSFTQYNTDFHDGEQERAIGCLQHCKDVQAMGWLSNRDVGDEFFEDRWAGDIKRFDTTYTAGRRKKTADGFEAKRAVEVLLTT